MLYRADGKCCQELTILVERARCVCLFVGVCEYERAGAAAVCGTEVGVGDVVGAVHVAVNELGEKGGTAVAEALKTNTKLTDLDLACE